MIYNMVHNEQDAWDLAQDSFVKAWKSIKRFRGQSSFYTWIYRIVMNVTIDWLRKKQIKGGWRRIRRCDSAARKLIPLPGPCRSGRVAHRDKWSEAKSARGSTRRSPSFRQNIALSF